MGLGARECSSIYCILVGILDTRVSEAYLLVGILTFEWTRKPNTSGHIHFFFYHSFVSGYFDKAVM
ncbi:hypothetical protein BC828DRAFT_266265 [Blastocladiella britannica]|nr:hypothetical protein BC828DRAFT_266265 [Blastocladiella britannica]